MEELSKPLYPRRVFEKMADASWGVSEDCEYPLDLEFINGSGTGLSMDDTVPR